MYCCCVSICTDVLLQLEKQKKHLAAYYGNDDQAADSDAEVV